MWFNARFDYHLGNRERLAVDVANARAGSGISRSLHRGNHECERGLCL